jgi:hypothetical protein
VQECCVALLRLPQRATVGLAPLRLVGWLPNLRASKLAEYQGVESEALNEVKTKGGDGAVME